MLWCIFVYSSAKMAMVKQEHEEEEVAESKWLYSDQWLVDSVEMKEEEEKPNVFGNNGGVVYDETDKYDETNYDGTGEETDLVGSQVTNDEVDSDSKIVDRHVLSHEEGDKKVIVSDVLGNLCRHQCNSCKKMYETVSGLRKHFKKTGHATQPFNFKSCLFRKVFYTCKICQKKTLCDKHIFLGHARQSHRIQTLAQYLQMTGSVREVASYKREQKRKEELEKLKVEMINSAPVSTKVGNLCRFKCQTCAKKYASKGSLHQHLKVTGHAEPTESVLISSLSKAIVHKCQICSKRILCDLRDLRNHIQVHKIDTLKDYIDKTNLMRISYYSTEKLNLLYKTQSSKYEFTSEYKNSCKFKCTRCAYTCSTWSSLTKHVSVKKHGPLDRIAEYLQKIVFFKCNMCDETVFCEKRFIRSHFYKHKLTVKTYHSSVKHINSVGEMRKKYM